MKLLFQKDLSVTVYVRDKPTDGEAPTDAGFGSKVGQIGPKWDKSGAFSDQISVHVAPPLLVRLISNGANLIFLRTNFSSFRLSEPK